MSDVERAGNALSILLNGNGTFEELDPKSRQALQTEVLVILEALRQPGEEMIEAVVRFSAVPPSEWPEAARRVWEAVLDKAAASRPN